MLGIFQHVHQSPVQGTTALHLREHGVSLARVVQSKSGLPQLVSCEHYHLDNQGHAQVVIAALVRKYNLKKARCHVLLDHGYKTVIINTPPEVPKHELKEALRWQVQDIVDIPVNELTIDYFDVPAVSGTEKGQRVNVVVAENSALRETVELLHNEDVDIAVIDIPELAQVNIARLLPEEGHDGVAMLTMHSDGGIITISKQGELYLSREVTGHAEIIGQNEHDSELNQIYLEIQRSLDFYESHFRQPAIHKLYVMLLNEKWQGLIPEIARNLYLDVTPLKLETLLDAPADVVAHWQETNFYAIGAALRPSESSQ